MRKEPKFKKISFKEFSLAKHVNTKLHKSIIRSKIIKAPQNARKRSIEIDYINLEKAPESLWPLIPRQYEGLNR